MVIFFKDTIKQIRKTNQKITQELTMSTANLGERIMTENNKKKIPKNASSDIIQLILKKIVFFEDIIQKTILHIQKNKMLDIVGVSEVNRCIHTLFDLSSKIKEIKDSQLDINPNIDTDQIINVL